MLKVGTMNFAEKAASLFNKQTKHSGFKTGDRVSVRVRVREGDKERIQVFKGNVIKVQGSGTGRTFTVRKMSGQFGVERTWPLSCPSIERVDLIATGKVRRSKIFYLRGLKGRAARIQSNMVMVEKSSSKDKREEKISPTEKAAE